MRFPPSNLWLRETYPVVYLTMCTVWENHLCSHSYTCTLSFRLKDKKSRSLFQVPKTKNKKKKKKGKKKREEKRP
jgi:hypothetical protein